MAYIDYNKIFTYSEADVYYITGARGTGKTFGARVKAIERYDRAQEKYGDGGRFCAITRFAKNKEKIERGYFEKIQAAGYFTEYNFTWKNDACLRNKKGTDTWECVGYCVALTDQGITKEETYTGLKYGTIIFDEVALDRRDTFHRYLKDEYDFYYLSILNSVFREQPGEPLGAKIIMLSNAVDMLCPYYSAFGVTYDMLANYGTYWCLNKSVLFINSPDMPTPEEVKTTIVGRLSAGSEAQKMMYENKYEGQIEDFIAPKTDSAKYVCGLVFNGDTFGLWYDGYLWYVNSKIPKGQGHVYTLTLADNRINYQALRKADVAIGNIIRLHYAGRVRYHNVLVQAKFSTFLKFVGVS